MNEVDNGKHKKTEFRQGIDLGASWNCYLISPNRRVENRGQLLCPPSGIVFCLRESLEEN